MSTTLKIVDMRLDKDEVSFLEKNKIKHEQKKDLIGNLFSVDCSALRKKFCNCYLT